MVKKSGCQHNGKKKKIAKPFEPPLLVSRLAVTHGLGRSPKVERVRHKKYGEQHPNPEQPHRPALLDDPPKGDSLEVAKKERGIAHRREAAANIRNDENKKDDVVARQAIFVHSQPGTN